MKGYAKVSLSFIGVACCLVSASCQRSTEKAAAAEQRGVDYLLSQQGADGLWHSPNYGNLKEGAAISAFVVYALSNVPLADRNAIHKAINSLAKEIRKNGYVTNPDGPDYTNYGSAMLLKAIQCDPKEGYEDLVLLLERYLLDSQLDSPEGFPEDNIDFGGWDLTGYMTGSRPTTGTNISVTAEVLEALATVKNELPRTPESNDSKPETREAFRKARIWMNRTRNQDGGFHFHPQSNHAGNKAGWATAEDRSRPLSYGTATADGLRLLTAIGEPTDSELVAETVAWFGDQPELDHVPGFAEPDAPGSWANGLKFYYYQSLSRSLRLFPKDVGQKIAKQIISQLEREQHANGSWSNQNARMREDDPLIATSFAIIALQNCRAFMRQ